MEVGNTVPHTRPYTQDVVTLASSVVSSTRTDDGDDAARRVRDRLLQKHPRHVPTIFSCGDHTTPMARSRFLIPEDMTGAQLHYVVRRRLTLEKEHALFLFAQKHLVPTHSTARELYQKYPGPDGHLHIVYARENVFG